MQQLANLDCFFLAKELAARLEGSFFENFYDFSEGLFRIRFSKKPGASVLVDLRGFAFAAEDSVFPEPPRQPSSFAMLLRKHLDGMKLSGARQLDFDRIIEFEFSSAKGRRFLVVELFGKEGNLLLLDETRGIIAPFRQASYAHRSLRRGEAYSLPPSLKKHPLDLQPGDLQGKGKIVSFLSKQTSLAPFYLEEACARAGVGLEAKVEDFSEVEKNALLKALKTLFEKPSPRVFLDGGRPTAFSSVEMQKLAALGSEKFESLSQAVAQYYSSLPKVTPEQAEREEKKTGRRFQLESQEKALLAFEAKAEELQKAGKWVFENGELVEEFLGAAKSGTGGLSKIAAKHGLKAKVEAHFLEIEKA